MTRSPSQDVAQAVRSATGHGGSGLPLANPEQLRALVIAIALVLAMLALGVWGSREWLKLRQQGASPCADRPGS